MKIGIDFDNTIVCYDNLFHRAATQKKLIPDSLSPLKNAIRNFLRSAGKEEEWTKLQGFVYGPGLDLALPYPSVDTFFSLCKGKQLPIFIISHKTRFPFLGPRYDLHASAKSWLAKQQFTEIASTFFEETLQDKLQRIRVQQCDLFIDDLPELLQEESFPSDVQKVLFDPYGNHAENGDYLYAKSWDDIIQIL